MNALVTGGAGFIGSHLTDKLLSEGNAVTVVDDLSTGSLDNLADAKGHPRFCFVRETVRNEAILAPLVERADIVYHLAAAVGVQLIVESPVHMIETNIHGSEVMLSLASRYRRPIFLASTSEVYGKNNAVPFREDSDMVYGSTGYSRWAYACSKVIDEYLALAYFEENRLPVTLGRLFNVIGPRQTGAYGMVVPRFVTAALRNEPIEIYGSGEQTRCFCDVHDTIEAIGNLPQTPHAAGEVFNIGATKEITINDLADTILELTGSASKKIHIPYEEAFGRPFADMQRRLPDITKLQTLTGWSPKKSLKESLQSVMDSIQS